MVVYLATENETSLLDDIDEIGYGELYDVRHVPQEPSKEIEITRKMKSFFVTLKIIQRANKLIIHEGEPVTLEYRGRTENGRRCLKRMRL